MAFWRSREEVEDGYESTLMTSLVESPEADGTVRTRVETPRLMVAATAVMVAATVALTVFAGPLFSLGDRTADGIMDRDTLITEVISPEVRDG